MKSEKDSIYERIKALEVGEKIGFPIERLTSIRTLSSNAAIMFGRKHRTYSDRDAKEVYIVREK